MEHEQNSLETLFIKNEIVDEDYGGCIGADSIDKTLCGQIFRYLLSGKLSFVCTICSLELESITNYVYHLTDIHYSIDKMNKVVDNTLKTTTTAMGIIDDNNIDIIEIKEESINVLENDTTIKSLQSIVIENIDKETKLESSLNQKEEINKINTDTIKSKQRNNTSIKQTYSCYFCNEHFFQPYLLQKHLKICSSQMITYASDATAANNDNNKINKNSLPPKYQCKLCDVKFKHVGKLKYHNLLNENGLNESIKCKVCGRIYKILCEYTKHKKKCHRNLHRSFSKKKQNNLVCDICKKTFTTVQGIRIHMEQHGAEGEFKCKICEKTFTLERYMIIHMRAHTGEKPYQCQLCGECFKTTSRFAMHMRRHNGDLDRHKCEICGNAYRYPKMLIYHMRTHTGEKPDGCDICGKHFSSPLLLKSHKRFHSGEKPYKCHYCGISFSQPSNRTQHEKQKHNILK